MENFHVWQKCKLNVNDVFQMFKTLPEMTDIQSRESSPQAQPSTPPLAHITRNKYASVVPPVTHVSRVTCFLQNVKCYNTTKNLTFRFTVLNSNVYIKVEDNDLWCVVLPAIERRCWVDSLGTLPCQQSEQSQLWKFNYWNPLLNMS